MGLGKSAQAIKALEIIQADRVIVLCPAVARINWCREFSVFSQRAAVPVMSSSSTISGNCNVISYDLLIQSSIVSKLRSFSPYALILDECHYLKNPESKRTMAVLSKSGLVHGATNIMALSGTPMPNHPGELWTILYVLRATSLSYASWVDRYCLTRHTPYGPSYSLTKNPEAIAELRTILRCSALRRTKAEVMPELPPIKFDTYTIPAGEVDIELNFMRYTITGDRGVQKLHHDLAEQEVALKGALKLASSFADKLHALAGADNAQTATLRQYVGLQKVPAVVDLISAELEHGEYEKIVLFAHHRAVIEALRMGLSRFGAVTLFGGTDPSKKQRNVDKFQNDPKCQVFIGNIQAAGIAINLTAASNVAMVESDWVPANNAQAIMRCHRIGQKQPVFVRFFSLADSIDEEIQKVLRTKTRDLALLNLA